MAVSPDFIQFVTDQFSALGSVEIKRMFGGAGVYLDGRMFALLDDNALYLKGCEANREQFARARCRQFEPWPGHKMDYFAVPADVLEDRSALATWSKDSVAAAGKSRPGRKPAKQRRKPNRR